MDFSGYDGDDDNRQDSTCQNSSIHLPPAVVNKSHAIDSNEKFKSTTTNFNYSAPDPHKRTVLDAMVFPDKLNPVLGFNKDLLFQYVLEHEPDRLKQRSQPNQRGDAVVEEENDPGIDDVVLEFDYNDDSSYLPEGDDDIYSSSEDLESDVDFQFESDLNYMVDRYTLYQNQTYFAPNPQLKAEVELLQLIRKLKLPLTAFQDIQKWAEHAADGGHTFQKPRTRSAVFKDLRERYHMPQNEFRSKIVSWLPDRRPTVVYVRKFRDAVYYLMSNSYLAREGNFVFPDPKTPFGLGRLSRKDPKNVSQIHHGAWFKATHNQLIKPISNEILVPVLLYIDGIATDVNGRLGVTPLQFTLGIMKPSVRNKAEAWQTIYYHPDDDVEAAYHSQKTSSVDKVQNLHLGLEKALEDFQLVCEGGGLNWNWLPYAGREWKVKMKFAVCFVVGDTEMHDKLCGKFQARAGNVKFICRHCKCETKNLVNVKDRARTQKLIKVSDVDPTKRDADHFRSIAHHPINNTFHKLEFGDNEHNIHLATPGESLHMHQLGAEKRVVQSFKYLIEGNVPDSFYKKQRKQKQTIETIDVLGHRYGSYLCRQSDRNLPRTKFKNSLFSTTKKAAHENAGVCLDLLLAMLSDRGRQVLLKERTIKEGHIEDQIELFEMILGLDEWLKKGKHSREELKKLANGLDYYIWKMSVVCQLFILYNKKGCPRECWGLPRPVVSDAI